MWLLCTFRTWLFLYRASLGGCWSVNWRLGVRGAYGLRHRAWGTGIGAEGFVWLCMSCGMYGFFVAFFRGGSYTMGIISCLDSCAAL